MTYSFIMSLTCIKPLGNLDMSPSPRNLFTNLWMLLISVSCFHYTVAPVNPPPFRTFVVEKHCLLYLLVFELIVLDTIYNMQILTHKNILLLCPLHWVKTSDVSSCLGKNCKLYSLAIVIGNTMPIQITGQTFKEIKLADLLVSQTRSSLSLSSRSSSLSHNFWPVAE